MPSSRYADTCTAGHACTSECIDYGDVYKGGFIRARLASVSSERGGLKAVERGKGTFWSEEWCSRGHHECPVCKGDVDKDKVIPLYGRGESSRSGKDKADTGAFDKTLTTPNRPASQRSESAPAFGNTGNAYAEGSGGYGFSLFAGSFLQRGANIGGVGEGHEGFAQDQLTPEMQQQVFLSREVPVEARWNCALCYRAFQEKVDIFVCIDLRESRLGTAGGRKKSQGTSRILGVSATICFAHTISGVTTAAWKCVFRPMLSVAEIHTVVLHHFV
eukprot:9497948-Pyramimonas_sp.AAC.1